MKVWLMPPVVISVLLAVSLGGYALLQAFI